MAGCSDGSMTGSVVSIDLEAAVTDGNAAGTGAEAGVGFKPTGLGVDGDVGASAVPSWMC